MDWQTPSDYDYTECLCWEGWAWEFLRRYDAYIASYQEYMNEKRERIFTPPMKEGEKKNAWMTRCQHADQEPKAQRPVDYYASQWGLYWTMPDPKTRYTSDIRFKKHLRIDTNVHQHISQYFNQEGEYFFPKTVDNVKTLIGFDLSMPLPKQLKEANTFLAKEKKKLGDSRQKEISKEKTWRLYLRVLDAKNSNTKTVLIEKVLYPNLPPSDLSQRTKDLLDEAKKACKNYRLILARR